MKCDTAQRRLLAAERPDEPSGEVEAHLAACAACRAWQQRLAAARRCLDAALMVESGHVVPQLWVHHLSASVSESDGAHGRSHHARPSVAPLTEMVSTF